MAIFASLIAKLGLDISGWSSSNKKAVRDLQETRDRTKGILADIRADFGRSSNFYQLVRFGSFAGPVGGLVVLGKALKDATAKLADLTAEFKRGDLTAGQYATSLAKAVPILGAFFEAGQNIRGWLDGSSERMRKQAAEADAVAKAYGDAAKAADKWVKEEKEFADSAADTAMRARQEATLSGIGDETQRQIQQFKFEAQNAIDELHKKAAETVHQDQIDSINLQLNKLFDDPASKANNARIEALVGELKQLQSAKEKIDGETADTEKAINEKLQAQISETTNKRVQEDAKQEQEAAKQTAQKAKQEYIKSLEDKEQALEESMREEKEATRKSDRLAETQLFRNIGLNSRVGAVSPAANQTLAVQNKQLDELKAIKAELVKARADDDGGDVEVSVSF